MAIVDQNWLYEIILLAPGLLLSLTVHEYAHARTALAFGDPTAKHMGRVSLNPLRHLDPIGTIVLFLTRFVGWAKPVPVNPNNLHPRRLGDIMVSLAGPLSNLVLAVVMGILLKLWLTVGWQWMGYTLYQTAAKMLLTTMLVNVALCMFNLLPLFPLDGHHIMRELLPEHMQRGFMEWQARFGVIVLMGLLFGPRLVELLTRGGYSFDPIGTALGWVARNLAALMGLL